MLLKYISAGGFAETWNEKKTIGLAKHTQKKKAFLVFAMSSRGKREQCKNILVLIVRFSLRNFLVSCFFFFFRQLQKK